jgi:hypothetical protein
MTVSTLSTRKEFLKYSLDGVHTAPHLSRNLPGCCWDRLLGVVVEVQEPAIAQVFLVAEVGSG